MIRTRGDRPWSGVALAVAALTGLATGCSSGSGGETTGARAGNAVKPAVAAPSATDTASASAPASPSPSASASAGTGKLVVSYAPPEAASDQPAETFLKETQVLDEVAAFADSLVALPHDVPLKAASCGVANAFWNPDTKDITYCYEFLGALRPVYEKQETTGTANQRAAAVDEDLVGLTNGVLFHELGHGLVAMYDLPITGKEEDAVDQLSALMLASGGEKYQEYAIDTINAWGGLAEAEEAGDKTAEVYADEHSLSIQRFYNWACWLYGSDPDAYDSVVETDGNPDGVLPEERAAQCPREFEQINNSWSTLLQPYLKN
ncbi:DUF4344 domain-containing metallopeptidase [Streptomyces sp. NPDC058486]|uniref:DUF4344 domain-containing metallopeptidase n=1 Tax=unclassified Streptomyces TaxID=2593676 RepID=UPI0036505B22